MYCMSVFVILRTTDLIYHYRDKELVGITVLHASEIGQSSSEF